jgi:hypothetical protein
LAEVIMGGFLLLALQGAGRYSVDGQMPTLMDFEKVVSRVGP